MIPDIRLWCPQELEKAAIKGIAPHVSDVVCDHIHGLAESAIHNMGVTAEDSFEETRRVDSAAHLEPYFALLKASDTLRMTLVVTWTPARGKVPCLLPLSPAQTLMML